MSGVGKFEIKTVFKHVEYDKKFDRGNMANVNDILCANPMQGVMEQIQEVIHESDLAHDDFIKECIVSVGIDPDALKATAELNVRLQKELHVARAMAVQKVEWISVEERLPEQYGLFLIADDKGNMEVASWTKQFGWFSGGNRVKRVTHWMPLPEPPQMKGGAG